MTHSIDTMVRDLYDDIHAAQAPLTTAEIMHKAGPVRPLTEPTATLEPHRPRVWIATAVAAAVIVLLGLVPILLSGVRDDSPPATDQVPTSTLPTSTTPSDVEVPPTETPSGSSADVSGWELLAQGDELPDFWPGPAIGELQDQLISVKPGVLYVYDTESESPRFIGTEPLGDDDQAWVYRSPDGRTWTRDRLEQFDGTWFRVAQEAGLLWLVFWDTEIDNGALYRSSDGEDWEMVTFIDDAGTAFVEPSPISHYFPSKNGYEWVRSGDTVLAPGRRIGTVEEPVWVSLDAGKSFRIVDPFGTPHTAVQVGRVGDGFFAVGAEVEQLNATAPVLEPPFSEVTYSTAFSEDGEHWVRGRDLTVPFAGGPASCPHDSDQCTFDGPLSKGASVNYMTYPITDGGPNQRVVEVVALRADLTSGTVAITEVARTRPCGVGIVSECIPLVAWNGPFEALDGLVIVESPDFHRYWWSSDGVEWLRLQDPPLGVGAGDTSIVGGSVYLWTSDEIWRYAS